MQNILVLKHYKLKNPFRGWPGSQGRPSLIEDKTANQSMDVYEEMKSMCIVSAKKFLLGLDEIVVHDTEVDDIQAAFKQHFYDLYDMWKSGSVNILYADLDVLFIRKFNWFDVSDHFVMYDPCNSGVRYHGHNMDEKLWELAFEMCKTWNFNRWSYEQDIYETMVRHPVNWPYQVSQAEEYSRLVTNRPKIESISEFYSQYQDCCAVHYHTSQGQSQVNSMKEMSDFLKL
jgi:hypothetical protein